MLLLSLLQLRSRSGMIMVHSGSVARSLLRYTDAAVTDTSARPDSSRSVDRCYPSSTIATAALLLLMHE